MLSAQQLTEILNAALQKLWHEDAQLFQDCYGETRTIHERTIVAKLLHHLVNETNGISISLTWDYEYNRKNGTEAKTILDENATVKHIVPDLILHERNTRNNCCAIEVKCKPSNSLRKQNIEKDFTTLSEMLKQLNYNFSIELIISNDRASLIWLTKNNKLANIATIMKYRTDPNLITVQLSTQCIPFETPHAYYVESELPKCVCNVLNELCMAQKIHSLS
jgi:hypothetical protein